MSSTDNSTGICSDPVPACSIAFDGVNTTIFCKIDGNLTCVGSICMNNNTIVIQGNISIDII